VGEQVRVGHVGGDIRIGQRERRQVRRDRVGPFHHVLADYPGHHRGRQRLGHRSETEYRAGIDGSRGIHVLDPEALGVKHLPGMDDRRGQPGDPGLGQDIVNDRIELRHRRRDPARRNGHQRLSVNRDVRLSRTRDRRTRRAPGIRGTRRIRCCGRCFSYRRPGRRRLLRRRRARHGPARQQRRPAQFQEPAPVHRGGIKRSVAHSAMVISNTVSGHGWTSRIRHLPSPLA
jgi:hypothetical protein